jgi:hypothetical protein
MKQVQINGQAVDVEIMADATPAALELTDEERATLEALDSALRADPEFIRTYPDARLERVDSMRALQDTDEGRFYLRYRSGENMSEFWACQGVETKLELDTGRFVLHLNSEPRPNPEAQPNPASSNAPSNDPHPTTSPEATASTPRPPKS